MKNPSHSSPRYKRILLKCSGEALIGKGAFGIDPHILDKIATDVVALIQMDVEIGLVIGGGNLFRGKALSEAGLGRVTGDHMGMLATVMNALALRDALERAGAAAHVLSAIPMVGIVESYHYRHAMDYLQQKKVVIFAAGTGNPFFTTDSAACLRAIEIEADIVLKATKVDGVYSADPIKNSNATRYDYLTYSDVLEQGLEVMDHTAICLCEAYDMPLQIFNMAAPNALMNIIMGTPVGTIVGAKYDK